MGCMKCGRETAENQAFCNSCLEVMKQYPIKPGIAIQLPSHKENPSPKRSPAPRRRMPTNEEIIRKLKSRVRVLLILWLVTLVLLAATIYPAVSYVMDLNIWGIGQNYSTFTETGTTLP